MRKMVIAGNWKMHGELNETVNLISGIKNLLEDYDVKCDVIVAPPFTSLETANTLVKDSQIKLSAQNMHFEDKGAFTGEISHSMLKSVGCEFVILGHSERRSIFGETDEIINKKITKALSVGLNPIFCIGETLEEREANITEKIVETQIRKGLENVSESDLAKIIIAYEPVWAIGTGKVATPEQAQDVHYFIRNLISQMYSKEAAENLTIQYGGSVKPDNAAGLLSKPDIDGALVGGACLKADSFVDIIKAC
ncbi:MAG: triose-phosphate isomerase [Melioribacteraceae bacterium]|nr:triose-phosphate isomerase [Melioribacteraceae bacterium]